MLLLLGNFYDISEYFYEPKTFRDIPSQTK